MRPNPMHSIGTPSIGTPSIGMPSIGMHSIGTHSIGRSLTWMLAVALLLAAGAPLVAAGEEPAEVRRQLDQLLKALVDGDYRAFIAPGNAAFKAALTRPAFEQVTGQLGPRFAAGYEAAYLGSLRQQGHDIYLWKLTFSDGGDDQLARLALKGDEVAGFLLQ